MSRGRTNSSHHTSPRYCLCQIYTKTNVLPQFFYTHISVQGLQSEKRVGLINIPPTVYTYLNAQEKTQQIYRTQKARVEVLDLQKTRVPLPPLCGICAVFISNHTELLGIPTNGKMDINACLA